MEAHSVTLRAPVLSSVMRYSDRPRDHLRAVMPSDLPLRLTACQPPVLAAAGVLEPDSHSQQAPALRPGK